MPETFWSSLWLNSTGKTGRSALKPATGDLHSADRAMRWGRAFSFWRLLQRRGFDDPAVEQGDDLLGRSARHRDRKPRFALHIRIAGLRHCASVARRSLTSGSAIHRAMSAPRPAVGDTLPRTSGL